MRAVPLLFVPLLAACPGPRFEALLQGEVCTDISECAEGLTCAHDGICRVEGTPGTFTEGSECVATAQCRIGLVCAAGGTCEEPGAPGTAGFDEACGGPDDCQLGLDCVDGTCKGLQLPFWPGTECETEADDGPFRVYFEVPDTEPLSEFYRLPFPNDARVDSSGRIDLSGHPTPGSLIDLVGDAVGNMIRVIEEDLEGGFGLNQAVFLRFSKFPDTGSLSFGLPGSGTISFVDVTPGDSGDENEAFGFRISSARGAYICDNWLAVTPNEGRPLQPGHTYAVIVTKGITDGGGQAVAADDDFVPMMADGAPTEERLLRAWQAYAPLRGWLADRSIDPNTLAGAAVFTTQDPPARAQKVREGVLAAPAPDFTVGPVLCGDGADPLADAEDDERGCRATSSAWHELQGRLSLPQFQAGTPPFKDFADGGGIDVSAPTPPSPSFTEEVAVDLTIPKSVAMPEDGWPLIVYAHGTGGGYTSAILSGFADRVTPASHDGQDVAFAVLGFDAPMHGDRRHEENWDSAWLDVDPGAYDPDVLFFNPLNPRAARDNALQQAADTWSLVRWALAFDVASGDSPTGEAIRFDPANVYYVGHSQGGVVGPVAVAWEPAFRSAVFSGAGGLTIQSLLEKTQPYDIPSAVRVGLADPDITREHPILNLVQQLAAGSDGVNHARHVLRSPPEDVEPRHVFQTFGVGDSFTPDITQYSLVRALGLRQVPNGQTPLDNVNEVSLPVSGNVSGTTAVTVLYAPSSGRDAHYVFFDEADARDHAASFLVTSVLDETPTVE